MAATPGPSSEDATASTLRTGSFRLYFEGERWEWSPEAAQIHGHDPAPMTLTTEQVMSYKHPDDRARILANMEHLRRTHEVTSSRYRMIDAHGQNRELIVVGQELLDETGAVIGSTAFYIDVTPEQDKLADALAVVVEHRSTIEQVKGMLMLVYGIDANTAFEILKWRSQEGNVKIRVLAEQLARDFLALKSGQAVTAAPHTRSDITGLGGTGPGGVAILCMILTDNRNRTAADVRHIFTKHGGSLGTPGTVAWQFDRKGVILIDADGVDEDALMEVALEAGAEDIALDGTQWQVTTEAGAYTSVVAALDEAEIARASSELTMVPQNTVAPDEGEARRLLRLIDALEDNDDVQDVYANFDISEDVLEAVAG